MWRLKETKKEKKKRNTHTLSSGSSITHAHSTTSAPTRSKKTNTLHQCSAWGIWTSNSNSRQRICRTTVLTFHEQVSRSCTFFNDQPNNSNVKRNSPPLPIVCCWQQLTHDLTCMRPAFVWYNSNHMPDASLCLSTYLNFTPIGVMCTIGKATVGTWVLSQVGLATNQVKQVTCLNLLVLAVGLVVNFSGSGWVSIYTFGPKPGLGIGCPILLITTLHIFLISYITHQRTPKGVEVKGCTCGLKSS